jgi:carbamoyltransferase
VSQLILAVHTGIHDAAVALLVDYDVKTAVQLERLTRFKGDSRTYPDLCIEELLDMVGATRRDVDARPNPLGFSGAQFPPLPRISLDT